MHEASAHTHADRRALGLESDGQASSQTTRTRTGLNTARTWSNALGPLPPRGPPSPIRPGKYTRRCPALQHTTGFYRTHVQPALPSIRTPSALREKARAPTQRHFAQHTPHLTPAGQQQTRPLRTVFGPLESPIERAYTRPRQLRTSLLSSLLCVWPSAAGIADLRHKWLSEFAFTGRGPKREPL